MCNLYSVTKGQQAIREFLRATQDRTGNLPPLPGVFPDTAAPVVRVVPGAEGVAGSRELTMMRWGMPSPAFVLKNRKTDPGVTNIRNVKSPHWRRWLGTQHRCVVPFTSFSEYEDQGGRKVPVFAGLWTSWTSVRKVKEGEVTADLFGFLTSEPNAEVRRVHPKAMPVILTEPAEIDLWLTGPWEAASALQRPLPDGALRIVAEGAREDGGEAAAEPAQPRLL